MTKEKALSTVGSIIFSNESRIEDLLTEVDIFVSKYSTDSKHSGMFFERLEKFVKEYNGYIDNIELAKAQQKALEALD